MYLKIKVNNIVVNQKFTSLNNFIIWHTVNYAIEKRANVNKKFAMHLKIKVNYIVVNQKFTSLNSFVIWHMVNYVISSQYWWLILMSLKTKRFFNIMSIMHFLMQYDYCQKPDNLIFAYFQFATKRLQK